MLFDKALKVVSEELREELTWEEVDNFLHYLWVDFIKVEFEELKQWDFEKFKEAVMKELEARNWNIRDFRSSKNEPISNVFKKVIRMIAKEEGVSLSNDSLSRILNALRKQYSAKGKMTAGIYPPVAFRERSKWNIYEYLGDSESCFQRGGCNEANVDWIMLEYEKYKRAYFTVFHYQQGDREGWGRCWTFKIDNAVFATNFYSKWFEIKSECFKYTIVRLLRKLFGLSENVKFAVKKYAPLPIYLNGDGIVIYEPSSYQSSDEVFDKIGELESQCLWCGAWTSIKNLYRVNQTVRYEGRDVSGLIVCGYCSTEMENMERCEECGEFFDREEMHYVEDYGYICQSCFEGNWFYCDECEEPHHREYAVFAPDGRVLCENCAYDIGARCSICGEYYYFDKEDEEGNTIQSYEILYRSWEHDEYICSKCAEKHIHIYQCEECGTEVRYLDRDYLKSSEVRAIVRMGICSVCYHKRERELIENSFEGKDYPSLFKAKAEVDPSEDILREILSE
jgi:hypothetical protein